MAPIEIIVGLGGNLGTDVELRARFDAAVDAVALRLDALEPPRRAGVYRSAPLGPIAAQPAFLNSAAAIVLSPRVTPMRAMATMLEIEASHGRVRDRELAQGPRALDLDILLWGEELVDEPGPPRVIAPHPRLGARRFALEPLRELLGPEATLPGQRSTLDDCLARVADQAVVRL